MIKQQSLSKQSTLSKNGSGGKKVTQINIDNGDSNVDAFEEEEKKEFDIENDPDKPIDAVHSNIIIEEIEMNGKKQKVYRKTY